MNKPDRHKTFKWGLKPRILAWIIPIFLVASVVAVIFNYIMARSNDEKRVADYVHQRRMDLIYLTSLPSLRMYLMNLKLGLMEEAAFVKEDVQLYNMNYLKNQDPSYPHVLSLVSPEGKELLKIENGEIRQARQDFSTSPHFVMLLSSRYGKKLSLPEIKNNHPVNSRIVDVYPIFSELNNRIVGGVVYEYEIPYQRLMQHSQGVFLFNIFLMSLTTIAALSMIYFALASIIKPLNQLTRATQKMMTGDLSKKVVVEGSGETRTLAVTFEELRQQLGNHIRELRENSRKLEAIIDFLPVATFIIDNDKRVIFWNKAIEEMTGLPREEVIGKGDLKYAVPFYGVKRPILIDLVFETDEEVKGKYQNLKQADSGKIEATTWCPTLRGQNRFLFGTASALYDDEGKMFGAIESISDMTEHYEMEQEKKQLQAQLMHAQKLKAVGTLAGGVAHDFNNLIHAIQGYTEILLLNRTPESADYAKLTAIKKAVRRASELTSQLLIFSRKGTSKLQPMDLNQGVRDAYELLQRIIPKMIHIELNLSDDLGIVNADSLQLEQVIMNLAINARDAMPEGGRIIIETSNTNLDERFCGQNPGSKPGAYAKLRFSDTGQGMDEETLAHIFEPFFTTKETGKGTGLGLAMVYGIVKNHEGYIICSSEPGKGTRFEVYFHVSTHKQETIVIEESGSLEGGNETILLVDDDETVRALGEDVLTTFGYKVLLADTGEKGLEVFKEKEEWIDLIILDMIMPGMGGKKCLEELLKINPAVKVIVASGYSHEKLGQGIRESDNVTFLAKPYETKKMLDQVREALG